VLQKKIFDPAGVVPGSSTSTSTIQKWLASANKMPNCIITFSNGATLKISSSKKYLWAGQSGAWARARAQTRPLRQLQ